MSMTIQQAIRALNSPGDHLKNYDEYGIYIDNELKEALTMAISALKEQEENRWIPVTERMPKEHKSIIPDWKTVSDPVMVLFVCTTSKEPYPENCVVRECISRGGEFIHTSYSGEYKAIAWKPRPTPPKEVE